MTVQLRVSGADKIRLTGERHSFFPAALVRLPGGVWDYFTLAWMAGHCLRKVSAMIAWPRPLGWIGSAPWPRQSQNRWQWRGG